MQNAGQLVAEVLCIEILSGQPARRKSSLKGE
jgi:hypothetical protein